MMNRPVACAQLVSGAGPDGFADVDLCRTNGRFYF
jgi:hypothetical protein